MARRRRRHRLDTLSKQQQPRTAPQPARTEAPVQREVAKASVATPHPGVRRDLMRVLLWGGGVAALLVLIALLDGTTSLLDGLLRVR